MPSPRLAASLRAVLLPAAACLLLAGCPVPQFIARRGEGQGAGAAGWRSGGPAAPGGQVPYNTVRMTGQGPFGPADGAPPRPRVGDRSARRPYLDSPDASWPGLGPDREEDDLWAGGQDLYGATDFGRLDQMPGLYNASPGAMAQIGVDTDPQAFADGLYGHPDSLAARLGEMDDLAGMMQMTRTTRGGDHNAVVDPEGRYLYYASTRWGKNPQIARQRIGGAAVERITQGQASDLMPAVSPDGQTIAWTSNRYGAWNLLAREIDAPPQAAPARLTQSETDDIHPSWSHDGRLLAFSRYNPMDARWELWVMDFPRRTLACVGPGLFPAFCPVAKRQLAEGQPVYTLAFQNHRQRDIPFYSVWTMEVAFRYGRLEAVGPPVEVVASSDWAAITPAWSPSGDYLAFASVRQSPLARAQARLYRADQIWVVRADGADLTPVTSHAAPNWYPCWAPEENNPMGRLYFTSSRGGYPNVWSVRPNVPGLMQRYARQGLMPSPRD